MVGSITFSLGLGLTITPLILFDIRHRNDRTVKATIMFSFFAGLSEACRRRPVSHTEQTFLAYMAEPSFLYMVRASLNNPLKLPLHCISSSLKRELFTRQLWCSMLF